MTDEQKPRLTNNEITELKRILAPMLLDKTIDRYSGAEVMAAVNALIWHHAELLLAYDALPYIQGYYDAVMAETTELREAMFEPEVKEMLQFGTFVQQPFAKIAEFLRAEAKRRAMPEVADSGSDSPPRDWLEPNWQHADRIHNWRNYISEELQVMWQTFTPMQRLALVRNAENLASNEDWD